MQIKIVINVVDDDPVIPGFIQEMFKTDDMYSVSCFSNPNDFFTQFSKDVDLVITDVRIPGYDVLTTLKTIETINPGCYRIVMSAYFDVAILKEFIKLRVDAVVEKGSSMDWLDTLKDEIERLKPKLLNKIKTKK